MAKATPVRAEMIMPVKVGQGGGEGIELEGIKGLQGCISEVPRIASPACDGGDGQADGEGWQGGIFFWRKR